jgi:hypothetical protein
MNNPEFIECPTFDMSSVPLGSIVNSPDGLKKGADLHH